MNFKGIPEYDWSWGYPYGLGGGTCRQPWVKGLTIMVNSIYNGWRFEDVWLDK